jgi:hypothetical protein
MERVPEETEEVETGVPYRTSGMAVLALILSCLSVFIGPFGFIPATILGHAASGACRRDPGLQGAGYARAALWVGYIFLALFVLAILAVTGLTPMRVTVPD